MKEYWQLFKSFAKIGAFTIGGGLAMIPLIKKEVVDKHGWIDEDEFMDIFAMSQSLPGLLAVNISIFLGYKVKGPRGSVVATIGSVLPPFLIILAVAIFFAGFKDNTYVNAAFIGLRPVVVALIAVPTVQLAIKQRLDFFRGALAFVSLLAIVLLKVSPIYILLVVAVLAVSYEIYREKKR